MQLSRENTINKFIKGGALVFAKTHGININVFEERMFRNSVSRFAKRAAFDGITEVYIRETTQISCLCAKCTRLWLKHSNYMTRIFTVIKLVISTLSVSSPEVYIVPRARSQLITPRGWVEPFLYFTHAIKQRLYHRHTNKGRKWENCWLRVCVCMCRQYVYWTEWNHRCNH